MSDPSGPDPFIITVGATSFNVRHGRVTTTINEPDTASGTVSADDMARSPTDWRLSESSWNFDGGPVG